VTSSGTSGQETGAFPSVEAWEAWLDENQDKTSGIWLQLARKGSGIESISRAEALDVALCYGWIDAQAKGGDNHTWLQRFVPRRPRSRWSQVNTEHIARLTAEGRMKPAGLREVERAKADGRWVAAYEPQSRSVVPDDLQRALDAEPRAAKFFASLDSRNRYAILHRIAEAKRPETRTRRVAQFVDMLAREEKIY
jgi:uncharacterized protein YdeI (YjbR/CyaY-like superfamily)